MGLNIKWDITYKCNLFCKHCINGKLLSNKSDELTTAEVFGIIDKISSSVEIDYIHFLGGEPTCRNDLTEICNYLSEKNIDFGFNTNCIDFDIEKNEEILKNKNFKYLIVSLEGPNAELNDLIRGKNVFNRIINNLNAIINFKKINRLASFKIKVNTVVSKTNYNHIIDMIDLCIELGVDELDLLQLIIQGNAENLDISINPEEEIELVGKIAYKHKFVKDKLVIVPKFVRPMAKDYCEKVLGLSFPEIFHGCSAGMTFAFINNLGYIYPCDRYLYEKLKGINDEKYNLRKKDFFEVWGQNDYDVPFKTIEGEDYETKYQPCNKCNHFKKECFPCFLILKDLKAPYHMNVCDKYFEMIDKNNLTFQNN
ncbi:radical SAM/SPASM domain-containing protein [Clostridium butanoliproducens]|uniref:radical SAM/SPASM domain-containing protein n=1 Tax=Clostridium butanoliproducens TaxID=2991837 RepID=UPI0024B9B9A3|nr:radical SAM protein [Clostridium butanoliproducens]